MCTAMIPSGKDKGTYTGRIVIRHRPSFRLGEIDVQPRASTLCVTRWWLRVRTEGMWQFLPLLMERVPLLLIS